MEKIIASYQNYCAAIKKKGLRRVPPQEMISHTPYLTLGGEQYLSFSSNDYLGLSRHPLLIERSHQWAQQYGVGATASRLVSGNIGFTSIENTLARFKGKESSLIFSSGFQVNAAVLSALLDDKVLGQPGMVFFDKSNHASLYFGLRASKCHVIRYPHNSLDTLETLLKKHKDHQTPQFIVSESLFSMEGDEVDLKKLVNLGKLYNAFIIIDDAHATGVLGEKGQGLTNIEGVDLILGTFGKAFGSYGGYVACSTLLRDYLLQKCKGLIYSTALPPPVLGSISAALELIPSLEKERRTVLNYAKEFRSFLKEENREYGESSAHIVPLLMSNLSECVNLLDYLKSHKIFVPLMRPPTVSKSLLRFSFTALHQEKHLDTLTNLLKAYFKNQ